MNFWQAIFLGFVQGVTEFLPVSSSAHIRIAGALCGMPDPGAAFTAVIQLGTETAVILYFRKDIARILSNWFRTLFGADGKDLKSRLGERNADAKLGWYIIVGTVPIVAIGLLFQKQIQTVLRNMWITAIVFIVFGILLWYFDEKSKQDKKIEELNLKDSICYGLGQMLALIPGVSRSGGTITVGRAMGYTREAAARISFLMAIPAVFGAGILETFKAVKDVNSTPNFPGWPAVITATLVSFVVGYLLIIVFLKIVSTYSYKPFCIYRIALAILLIVLMSCGVLDPMAGTEFM